MPRSIELLFCGLVFWIYDENGMNHHLKHVEVAFKRHRKGIFDIETGELLKNAKSTLERHEVALAKKVIQKYRKKLLEDWNKMQQGNGISKFCINNRQEIFGVRRG